MTVQGQSDYVGGLPAGCLLNEYQIERVLGHGGFGVTYLARDTLLQKTVAIKEYLPTEWAVRQAGNTVSVRSSEDRIAFEQGQTSFLNEARVLARFTHPNLIAIYRFFQANNTAYFVMEYAEGETLRTLIKRQGTLDEAHIKKLLLPVIQGLEGVHLAGIMHRDIKPENILVRKDQTAVLIDFGAARIATGSKSRAITSVLTAGYAPVEQYSTSGNQGPWTDIYAFGAVMYHAICGRKPLDAISRIADDALVPASLAGQGRYRGGFLAAVDWALRVKADERPKSLPEWRFALEGSQPAPAAAATHAAEVIDVARLGESAEAPHTVRVAAPEPRAVPLPAAATRLATPTVAPSRPQPAAAARTAPRPPAAAIRTAHPVTPAAAVPHDAAQTPKSRSAALLWAAAAVLAIAGAGAAGWYFSRLAAPPAPQQTEAAPPVPAPKVVAPAPDQPTDPDLAGQKELERQKQAAEQQKNLELERQRQAELQQRKREEERRAAEKRAQEQLEQQKRAEAERQARLDAERKRQAEEEAKRKAEEEAKRRAEAEAKLRAEEEARRQAEEEAKRKAAEADARRKAEEEAKKEEPKDDAPIGF